MSDEMPTYVWTTTGYYRVEPGGITPAEALDILYRAATRDPYHGDAAHLVECRMVLERALGVEEGE